MLASDGAAVWCCWAPNNFHWQQQCSGITEIASECVPASQHALFQRQGRELISISGSAYLAYTQCGDTWLLLWPFVSNIARVKDAEVGLCKKTASRITFCFQLNLFSQGKSLLISKHTHTETHRRAHERSNLIFDGLLFVTLCYRKQQTWSSLHAVRMKTTTHKIITCRHSVQNHCTH